MKPPVSRSKRQIIIKAPNINWGRIAKVVAILSASAVLLMLSHYVFPKGLLHTALHEIGFALLVSIIVWALFEAQLSHEAETAWQTRIQKVTENVFQAVLRKDLPKALLDEANNLVLNSSLIREDFAVTYTLSDEKFQLSECETDCVIVDSVMEFRMRNVGTETVHWPVRASLPNPIHPDLKTRVGVRSLAVVKGGQPVMLDLENARTKFAADIADNNKTAIVFCPGEVSLAPGESCQVSASYTMAKEAEDTELLGSLYPSDGLKLTIFDKSGADGRLMFARAVHRNDLLPISEGIGAPGVKIFKIDGYLLPHQGVLIWWKRKPQV